ncbi:MAG TPA: ASCH domain-containing protein [Blastocatellia bacterium]|nr:ASCH domain-containing protein [Blastocatellia bacterium]
MTFTKKLRMGVKLGRIKCSIRIWKNLRVKVGGRYPLDDGHIVVESIEPITMEDITDDLAQESGFDNVDSLMQIAKHGSGDNIYLVRFHYLPNGAWDAPRRK